MLIGLEGASHLLFAACYREEEENKSKTGVFLEKLLEVDANDNYIFYSSKDSNFDKNSSFNNDKNDDYWENITDSSQKRT